ncbi:MAG: ATP-binding protein [Phycisphaerales bacterium JB040]
MESPTRFDEERLESRLERVRASLSDQVEDVGRLKQLAMLGTVSGLIAHEVRNLMTPVKGYAQLALKRGDPELMRKALERALDGATQAGAIAESLMELAGTPGACDGTGEIACEDREGMFHVEHALGGLETAVEGFEGVELEIECEPGLLATIGTAELRQAAWNLVQNAARATAAHGGGVVRVVARGVTDPTWSLARELEDGGIGRDDAVGGASPGGACEWFIAGAACASRSSRHQESERVLVEVMDLGGGVGIDIRTVFGSWVTGRPGAGGRGLGLATCRALVEKSGGRVGVASAPGVGARFVLELTG